MKMGIIQLKERDNVKYIILGLIILILGWVFAIPREEIYPPNSKNQIEKETTVILDNRPDWVYTDYHRVVATIYHAVTSQTDNDPHILADGTEIDLDRAGDYRYCALSRNLLERWGGPYAYGDTLVLTRAGDLSGPWVVKDTMNARFTDRIDLLVSLDTRPAKFNKARIRRKG